MPAPRPAPWLLGLALALLAATATPAAAQETAVTGLVVEAETGDPLPGVAIRVLGTTRGTVTSIDGTYEVSASPQDSLEFSFVGYVTEVVAVAGRSVIDVALASDVADLDELVVVAYGETRRSNITGAVAEVSSRDIAEQPIATLEQSIAGRAPGVQVLQGSGIPGGGPEILVRGISSINAAQSPLYVIDGIVIGYGDPNLNNPLASIPPEEIESISILKDAAAAALYGSRANNGVVLVTTKKGRSGAPQISFTSRAGVQAVPEYEAPDLLNGQEFAQFLKESVIDNRFQPAFRAQNGRYASAEEAERWFAGEPVGGVANNPDAETVAALGDPGQYGEGTDWFDAITESAPIQEYGLNVRGGTDNVQYFVSGNLLDQRGVVTATGFRRYGVRTNLDAQISSRLRFSAGLAPSRTVQDRRPTDPGPSTQGFSIGGALFRARYANPTAPLRLESGEFNPTTFNALSGEGVFYQVNPVLLLENLQDQQVNTRLLANAALEYEPVDGLRLRTTGAVDGRLVRRDIFNPSTVPFGLFNVPLGERPAVPSGQRVDQEFLTLLSETTARYRRLVGGAHDVEVLAGFTAQQDGLTQVVLNGSNFVDDSDTRINDSTAETITGSTGTSESALLSWLGRLDYNFRDRYLLTSTVRFDGSSRFGADNKWGTFPSVSLGWRPSNEPFFSVPGVSELKLKASYGRTGNYGIGDFAAVQQIVGADYVFGGAFASGRFVGGLPQTDLRWEQTDEFNAGLDLGLYDNRLFLSTNVYDKTTGDLIYFLDIPNATGFGGVPFANIGSVRNRGFEVSIATRNLEGAFSWETEGNLFLNRNEVLTLNNQQDEFFAGGAANGTPFTISRIGEPLGQFWGLQLTGLYTQEEIDDPAVPRYPGALVGSPKFFDGNGNGQADPRDDQVVLGDPEPDFSFGLTNSFAWGGLDLRVVAYGSVGGEIFDLQREITQNIDGVFNVGREVLDRWRPGEDPTQFTVPGTLSPTGRQVWRSPNSAFVKDGSYLSVQNVALGYTLDPALLRAERVVRSARLYLSVQNALVISGFDGNPEIRRALDSPILRGVNYGSYPTTRTFTVGLNVSL